MARCFQHGLPGQPSRSTEKKPRDLREQIPVHVRCECPRPPTRFVQNGLLANRGRSSRRKPRGFRERGLYMYDMGVQGHRRGALSRGRRFTLGARDDGKLRVNRRGMAFREWGLACVVICVTWGRHRRGSASLSLRTPYPPLRHYLYMVGKHPPCLAATDMIWRLAVTPRPMKYIRLRGGEMGETP